MKYKIIVLGLESIGSNFSRELMRYLACYKNESGNDATVSFVDSAEVDERDLYNQFYLKQDIGYNKAATMKMIWESVFKKTDNLKVQAYSHTFTSMEQTKTNFLCYIGTGYYDNARLNIIIVDEKWSKEERVNIYKTFQTLDDAILIIVHDQGISIAYRSLGLDVIKFSDEKAVYNEKQCFTLGESLFYSHLLFTYVVNILSNKEIGVERLLMNYSKMATGKERNFPPVMDSKLYQYERKGKTALVCVGVGGTGGNFCKDAVKIILKHDDVELLMIDGDRVEKKNCIRQPFGEKDVLQFKADIMKEQLIVDYPELKARIKSFPCYLDSVEQLQACISEMNATNVILIGCVDNHRARQVMHQYYHKRETIIYMDSANEFSVGEVVISLKRDKEELSPLRSYYYPDVLTDNGPSASELSCGVVNESSPQHQVTNVAAAHIMIAHLERFLFTGLIEGGIEYFNSFSYFARFQPWECI